MAGVFRVGLQSGSCSVVQERYEGRLTTAREKKSGYMSEQPESVSEVGEKKD